MLCTLDEYVTDFNTELMIEEFEKSPNKLDFIKTLDEKKRDVLEQYRLKKEEIVTIFDELSDDLLDPTEALKSAIKVFSKHVNYELTYWIDTRISQSMRLANGTPLIDEKRYKIIESSNKEKVSLVNPLSLEESIKKNFNASILHEEHCNEDIFFVTHNGNFLKDRSVITAAFKGDKDEDLGVVYSLLKYFNKRLEKKTKSTYLKNIDNLTKIFNRRAGMDKLNGINNSAINEKRRYALFMLDIDNFKKFNDTYGHFEGDKVLYTVSQIVSEELRKRDMVSRFGGEELMGCLLDVNKEEAFLYLDNIRAKIKKEVKHRIGYDVTVSIGFDVRDYKSEKRKNLSLDFIKGNADDALYAAKFGTVNDPTERNKVVCYEQGIKEKTLRA